MDFKNLTYTRKSIAKFIFAAKWSWSTGRLIENRVSPTKKSPKFHFRGNAGSIFTWSIKEDRYNVAIPYCNFLEVKIAKKGQLNNDKKHLVGWLCFTFHRQRGHLETAPPFAVPCEGREALFLHRSHRESNPAPTRDSPLHYRCATQLTWMIYT